MCSVCTDFVDVFDDKRASLSRDDVKFLGILEKGTVQLDNGHYETPLPVKDPDLLMPNNRIQAERRMTYLKRKFEKQPDFHKGYTAFIQGMNDKGQIL